MHIICQYPFLSIICLPLCPCVYLCACLILSVDVCVYLYVCVCVCVCVNVWVCESAFRSPPRFLNSHFYHLPCPIPLPTPLSLLLPVPLSLWPYPSNNPHSVSIVSHSSSSFLCFSLYCFFYFNPSIHLCFCISSILCLSSAPLAVSKPISFCITLLNRLPVGRGSVTGH